MSLLVRVECHLGRCFLVRRGDSFEQETETTRIDEELTLESGATIKAVLASIAALHGDVRSGSALMVQIYRQGCTTAAVMGRLETVLDVALHDGDRVVFLELLPA